MGARRWPCRVHGGTSLAPGAPPLTVGLSPSASDGDSDVDSELEDRVDGVKSWLSKNKGSSKALSDDGSLKSSRWVQVGVSACRRGRGWPTRGRGEGWTSPVGAA